MRSKVSHFSGIIRFVIFICVILLLIYAVVHWSRQNKHQPVATNPSSSSQISDNSNSDKTSSNNKNKANNADNSGSKNDSLKANSADESNKKSKTNKDKDKEAKPSQIAGDSVKKSAKKPTQPANNTVPSTGLGLEQAIVATAGIGVTVYLVGNYWQTRDWRQISR